MLRTVKHTSADDLLLDGIRAGDEAAWARLVDRYQGRLVAFARGHVMAGSGGDAEDAVQDVFLKFLRGVEAFRGEVSLETWLFRVLRTRLIDLSRRHAARPCLLAGGDDAEAAWVGDEPTASSHAAVAEAREAGEALLAAALRDEAARHREKNAFAKLKALELLFYARVDAPEVARRSGLKPNAVAVLKTRTLARVGAAVREDPAAAGTPLSDGLLADAWAAGRCSCPKRSTIGSWQLGSLEPAWAAYVAFHLDELGCRACRANRDDLAAEVEQAESRRALRERILASSVGFHRR